MEFCKECSFLYRIREETDDDGKKTLMNVCNNCGFEEPNLSHTIEVIKTADIVSENIPDNIVHDVSLPKTAKKKCPNPECKESPEAVFITDKDMQIMYICVHCKTKWKLK